MQAHLDQGLSLGHELAGHADEEVRTITALVFLHLGGLGDHLSGRVVHIGLFDNSRGIGRNEKLFEMVDDHFVHA